MDETLEQFALQLVALSTPQPGGARRLLPERELGARLDVSRGALRERLSQLESIGVLTRRQGHGSYLQAADEDFIRTTFTTMRALGFVTHEDVIEAREMLETVVAVRAARAATSEQASPLRALVDDMVAATAAGDHDAALEADLRFHASLVEIVANPILSLIHAGLSHVLRQAMQERRARAIAAERPDADGRFATDLVHFELVEALEANDPDAARTAITRHFEVHSLITSALADPTPGASA